MNYGRVAPSVYTAMDALDQYLAKCGLEESHLPGLIAELKGAGVPFRNDVETGPVDRQIELEDPDGNPIELFESAH